MCAAMLLAAAATAPASAQTGQQPKLHAQLLKLALDNLSRARCGDQPCTPATAEERASPPLTDAQAEAIVSGAAVSAMAEHCGLDWRQRNFVPLMAHHRRTLGMSERQMAIVGLLHGIAMGALEQATRAQPCTPEVKATVAKRLLAPG